MKNFLSKPFFIVIIMISFVYNSAFSQTGVRIAGTAGAADNSAMLDVVSNSKGILVPRMTEAERTAISSPANGLLVYQTNNSNGFYFYDGPNSLWVKMSSGALGGSGADNFLARWVSNSLTVGATRDNGTNVGIGTAPTTNKLEVAGTANVTSNLTVGGTTTVTGATTLNGGLFTQGVASTLYGTNASIYANNANTLGGGIMVSDDGGFFDYNNGPVTFNGSTGLTIAGTSGAGSSNCYLKINQLAGTGTRPVWVDATGQLNNSGRVYASKTAESGSIGATNTAVLTTGQMTVVTGELIAITIAIELHFTTGSGNDRFTMQSQVNKVSGGCGTSSAVISTTISGMPSADHQGYYTYFFTDLWVADCSGVVTFQCNANRFDADDTWTHRNARILAIKQ